MLIREHEMFAPDAAAFQVRETAALASPQLFSNYDALLTGNHRCFTRAVVGHEVRFCRYRFSPAGELKYRGARRVRTQCPKYKRTLIVNYKIIIRFYC
jgi:hypothetical protein